MATRGRYIDERTARFFNSVSEELTDIKGQSFILYPLLSNITKTVDSRYSTIYKETPKKRYGMGVSIPANIEINKKITEPFEEAKFESKTSIMVQVSRERLKLLDVMVNEGDVVAFQRMFFEVSTIDDTRTIMGSPEFKFSIDFEAIQIRIDKSKMEFEMDIEV